MYEKDIVEKIILSRHYAMTKNALFITAVCLSIALARGTRTLITAPENNSTDAIVMPFETQSHYAAPLLPSQKNSDTARIINTWALSGKQSRGQSLK
jgi:hypothetical protein